MLSHIVLAPVIEIIIVLKLSQQVLEIIIVLKFSISNHGMAHINFDLNVLTLYYIQIGSLRN